MPPHPTIPALHKAGALACTFLLLMAVALPAWRWQQLSLKPAPMELLVAAALPALGLLAWRWPGPPRQVMLRLVCGVFMLPLLLLMWSSGLERTPARPATPPPPRLADEPLFAGALSQQRLPAALLQGSGVLLMRSAAFADGSELRLIRFADAPAARRYHAQLDALLRATPLDARLALYGADLLELRARSAALLQSRWQALALPAASPEMPSAPDAPPRPFWPLALAYLTLHIAFALGFLLWAGTATTRLPPVPGHAAVTPALLGQRLHALARLGLPLGVRQQADGLWRVEHRGLAEGRSHAALLRLDATARRVQVRELLTADAAAPQDEDEASLRGGLCDAASDPARPRADRVWQRRVQTTLLDPERLAALRLKLSADRVALAPGSDLGFDGEGMLSLLAALVTESGWGWQPVFWFRGR
ncbi:hypothetical protein G8A07_04085 [Roseateles sp. DAIF2]|uniref:hypothetical protein n=1 Tax=Roseateles sp. DAIF2 TaxID=2714952 RepID=UPI0018A28B2C|nr:hypothetical protein [Roseateles sp. DAIF2]QPF72188.1 hypothetical protein G8A07_04085 [Roseateles sp. DAIF2]